MQIECCNNKYRIVKISGGILAKKMLEKFEDYKNLSEYVKRISTVEPLIGILKRFYHIDELLSKNMTQSENKINICCGSLNLKRLYNQFMEMKDVNEDNIGKIVKSFCEKTNALMFILRETNFPFLDEKLKLPLYL